MADYAVRFSVHLIPSLVPEGWSNPVFNEAAFRVKDFEDLKLQINKYFFQFIKQRGIIVLKDTKKTLRDDIETMDLRRYIPMSNIAYIEHETKMLVGEMPDADEEGLVLN